MNIGPLRKSIIKESILFVVLGAVFGGGVFYLQSLHEEADQKKKNIDVQVQRTLEEKRQIETKFGIVKESLPLYKEAWAYAKNQGLFIDSQAVRDLFNQYQNQYSLKKITVEMQPIVELTTDPNFARKKFVATRSNVKVVMESLTDEDLYTMMQMLQKDLPGFVRIDTFSMNKKQELSKDVLAMVRKEGSYSMIASEMTFEWYGMKSLEPNSEFNRYVPPAREAKTP